MQAGGARPEFRGRPVRGAALTTPSTSHRARIFPEAAAASAFLWSSTRVRGARRGRGQGGAAVRRVEAATAGPLHRRLAGRWERPLPHREPARALRRPPTWRAQPRLSRPRAQPLRRLLLPRAWRARPCTWRLGLGLGGRRRLGRRRTRSRCLDPAARLGPRLGGLGAGQVPVPWRWTTPSAVPCRLTRLL